MRKLLIKFPSQIRISGWDFGSSARAMNQAGAKDSLMTYESVSNTQAVLEKVSKTTTERKIMSTKTSIKRIALVAVAALGFGMVSAVSSNATINLVTNAANPVFVPDYDTATSNTPSPLGSTANYTVYQTASATGFEQITAKNNVASSGSLISFSCCYWQHNFKWNFFICNLLKWRRCTWKDSSECILSRHMV
jgi:hypothetical protein